MSGDFLGIFSKKILGELIKNELGATTSRLFSHGLTTIKTISDVKGTIRDNRLSPAEKVALSSLQVTGSVATAIAGFKGGADGLLLGAPFGVQGAATGAVIGGTLYSVATSEAVRQLGVDPLKNYFYNN